MRMDPRTKLLILAVTGISVFLNGSLTVECVFAFVPLLFLLLAGQQKPMLRCAGLFLLLLLTQLFLVSRLPAGVGGVIYMFAVYIRKLLPCFMLGSYLMATTKVSTFLAAVSRLRLPKGFTIALSITLAYFPTMVEEWHSIRDAMALRGIFASAGALLLHPLRTMEYIYVPMLASASRISDEISQAAITRGIDHTCEQSCLEEIRFSAWDCIVGLTYAGIVAFMLLAPSLEVM